MCADRTIPDLLGDQEVRAAGFIVTVYGDLVVPRGGILWTGSLIDICGLIGLSESVVRTAVSRLVAAQQLQGVRSGRRSYYSLDASAHLEFEQAAKLLYQPDQPTVGWQVLYAPDLSEADARHLRMGHMGASVYLRPDRGQAIPVGAEVLHAINSESMGWLAQFWDLTALDLRYAELIRRFSPLLVQADHLTDEHAVIARLLLVHTYRGVLLRDPRLPLAALPSDWRGYDAQTLFRKLYLKLSPKAEAWISANCQGEDGFLPATTAQTDTREQGLLLST